eukprot:gnl/TRDRNA2_/TRDRNA2_35717_c0_seq1.p1 gnl/TRDRNA2_/TRDRNA2_35717_c0~~gnl/TRDRNA2_/TRDRNA2_35717_c0_seq1.p1  ORF type:complete len:244 (+),score=35.07 gnl/TRDRNA2_/TRDRNA2_35717_c0_seq1:50-733(+)
MAVALDCGVIAACLATPIAVIVGLFANIPGGNMPAHIWFTWHPILMSIAFPCLMVCGRWAYIGELWGPSKAVRRSIHRATMVLATVAMIVGYIAIFIAHWPKRQFFGYQFKDSKWIDDWKRMVHVWLGYGILILVLAQASMGMLKLKRLQDTGERTLTFHGTLGKVIAIAGGANILMAVWFWQWEGGLKAILVVLILLTSVVFAAGPWPRPDPIKDEDSKAMNDDGL